MKLSCVNVGMFPSEAFVKCRGWGGLIPIVEYFPHLDTIVVPEAYEFLSHPKLVECLPELGAQLTSNEGCVWPFNPMMIVVVWPLFSWNVLICANSPNKQPDVIGSAFPPSKPDDRGSFLAWFSIWTATGCCCGRFTVRMSLTLARARWKVNCKV